MLNSALFQTLKDLLFRLSISHLVSELPQCTIFVVRIQYLKVHERISDTRWPSALVVATEP
jgi:hypothetical protein